MKCFYHNDADGKCAGYLVNKLGRKDRFETEFIPISYEDKFPLDKIHEDEVVYIVDFSISPEDMRALLQRTLLVHWIDHHKTAIEKYADFEYYISGLRYDGVAGCMLTYLYLRNRFTASLTGTLTKLPEIAIEEIKQAPYFIRLIADWDVWKFEYGEKTKKFIVAFDSYDFSPQSDQWGLLVGGDYHGGYEELYINQGTAMMQYKDTFNARYLSNGFETLFESKMCYALNLRGNSEIFKSLPQDKYDAFITFVYDGEGYKISMYSSGDKSTDVSEICKKYGGGGHRGAAGCYCKELPFAKVRWGGMENEV